MRAAAALLILLFAGCSGSDDSEKALKAARSWSATLDIASRGLAQHELSAKYAKQVAEAAEQELSKHLDDAKDAGARSACQHALDSARHLRALTQQR